MFVKKWKFKIPSHQKKVFELGIICKLRPKIIVCFLDQTVKFLKIPGLVKLLEVGGRRLKESNWRFANPEKFH